MNETPVREHPVDTASVKARHHAEKSRSNRILGYAFVASVALNLGWVALVSHSHLFGKGSAPLMLHEKLIRIYKPILVPPKPALVPPKPAPVKRLPPPPAPPKRQYKPLKVQPKIKPLVQRLRPVTPQAPPRPAIHPLPPRLITPPAMPLTVTHPAMPHPVTHPPSVYTTKNKNTTSHVTAKPAQPSHDSKPFAPTSNTTKGTGTPPAGNGGATPGKNNSPANNAAPTLGGDKLPANNTAPVKADTPPQKKKEEVHHPNNWVPIDTQEASLPDDVGGDVTADGIDAGSTNNDKVVISFTIDETGRIRNARVKESCGNSELDNRFLEAVKRAHGSPAIQDHLPHDQPETKSFAVGVG